MDAQFVRVHEVDVDGQDHGDWLAWSLSQETAVELPSAISGESVRNLVAWASRQGTATIVCDKLAASRLPSTH